MSTLQAKIVADFTTSLATEIAIGGTSATLQSATDDDAVALPAGRYFFTIDGANSSKEHISCDLSGTALTNIKTVSRQGTETAGVLRKHRIGATVSITDFAHIFQLNNLLNGVTNLNASTPLGYDGTASITTANQLATKAYVDSVAVAGAPDASTTVKGNAEEATLAEVLARTAAGGTLARLFINPSTLPSTLTKDYAADSVGTDSYAITITPAITAYVAGQVFVFKAGTANTGACTLAVSGLSAITLKKNYNVDLETGDIVANQIVKVVYDGTNMQMVSLPGYTTENAANKDTDTALTANSDIKYPSQKAVKAYIDALSYVASNNGLTTKDISSTTTTTIAHGLGRTPRIIRLTCVLASAGAGGNSSFGSSKGSTESCAYICFNGTVGSASKSCHIVASGSNDAAYIEGSITVDGTNISITWAKTGSPTGSAVLMWEVL